MSNGNQRFAWSVALGALAVLTVAGWKFIGKQEHRESVGPWDTPDLANPFPTAPKGAPAVPDPTPVIHAKDNVAVMPDGTKVVFEALSRNGVAGPETDFSFRDRSWAPDGSPYSGPEIRSNGGDLFTRYSELENKGARYLTFHITSPSTQTIDVYGYVPDFAKRGTPRPELHGRDVPGRMEFQKNMATQYRPPIVVDDRSASRYLFAVASGPWTEVASVSPVPAKPAAVELARGGWGTLQMIPPPPERNLEISARRTMPTVTFRVDSPSEPPRWSYFIHIFDKTGRDLTGGTRYGLPNVAGVAVAGLKDVARITVECRPYTYAEFSGVHYDPDAKRWPKAYWGGAGEAAVQRAGTDAELYGIFRPKITGDGWNAGEFFAPDGKAWREFPNPNQLKPFFSTNSWPAGENLIAVLKLPNVGNRTARVETYAADSDEPGKGLREKLPGLYPYSTNRADNQILFVRPRSQYVQFEITSTGDEWTTAGEIEPPRVALKTYSAQEIDAVHRGTTVIHSAITVILRPGGWLDFYYEPVQGGPNVLMQKLLTWDGKQEKRLVGKLKSGKEVVLANNGSSSDGSIEYHFSMSESRGPILDTYQHMTALRDIETFEVQTRSFGKPVYVSAKLPPSN